MVSRLELFNKLLTTRQAKFFISNTFVHKLLTNCLAKRVARQCEHLQIVEKLSTYVAPFSTFGFVVLTHAITWNAFIHYSQRTQNPHAVANVNLRVGFFVHLQQHLLQALQGFLLMFFLQSLPQVFVGIFKCITAL